MSVQLFAQLPENIQETLATTAGIIVSDFNPNGPFEASAIQKTILFATTGGTSGSCVYTYKDHGADIDNCPKETMELMDVERVDCTMSGTAVTVTADSAVRLVGPADKGGSEVEEVTPRRELKPEDFQSIWYVCPYGKQAGFLAIQLKNALSSGGFSWQSEDRGKDHFAFSFKGYSSVKAPDEVPFKIYLRKTGALPAVQMKVEDPSKKGA